MAQSTRILFVAGEVTPFAESSSIASLARTLPEQVQEAGDFEARVMMPCYGNIDERKHNLHEVIRLSGTEVPMGTETETLTVKVASMPDIRLQVYFMDHDTFFSDGLSQNGEEASFEEVVRRVLFFDRAVLETIRDLRWGPSVVHSLGWMSSLIPFLLQTEYAGDEHLGTTKTVFTPDDQDPGHTLTSEIGDLLGLSLNGDVSSTLSETGVQHADNSIFPPGSSPSDNSLQFASEENERKAQLAELYNQMLNEVPA